MMTVQQMAGLDEGSKLSVFVHLPFGQEALGLVAEPSSFQTKLES